MGTEQSKSDAKEQRNKMYQHTPRSSYECKQTNQGVNLYPNLDDVRVFDNANHLMHERNINQPTSSNMNQPTSLKYVNQPTTSSNMKQPTSSSNMNQTTSLKYVNQPTSSSNMNQPTSSGNMNQPTSLKYVNQPTSSSNMNQPTSSSNMNQPTSLKYVNQPTSSGNMNQPTSLKYVNQPISSSNMNQPTSSSNMNQPTSLKYVNQPTSSGNMNQPTSLKYVNQPTSSSNMNQPTSSSNMNQPTSLKYVNQPTSSGNMNQPTSSSNMNQPTSLKYVNQPTSSSNMNQPTSSSNMNQPTSLKYVNQPTSSSNMNQLTSLKYVNQPTYLKNMNQTTSSINMNQPTTTNNMNQTTGIQQKLPGQRQKKKNPPSRFRSRSVQPTRVVTCVTCKGDFGVDIFQCANGHSSCHDCKSSAAKCGDCHNPITDMRNFALQHELLLTKTNCPNERCTFRPTMSEMEVHKKECPFQETECPLNAIPSLGHCSWKGKLCTIKQHFNVCHPERCDANINRDMSIPNICSEGRYMYLVNLGPLNFLVHVNIGRKVSMTVQFPGTKHSAAKWCYEFHVFNKSDPRRKYQYNGVCHSIGTPVTDIFNESDCAELPLPYAMTYVNRGNLTYRFYILKKDE